MSRDKLVNLIKERVKTEYDKYHNTPVDFIESAALKIVAAISFEENNLQSKLTELERENERLRAILDSNDYMSKVRFSLTNAECRKYWRDLLLTNQQH